MSKFTDGKDRKWVLEINPPVMKRVKLATGCNLGTTLTDEAELEKLGRDVILLVDIIFAIVQPEAEKRGVSEQDFGESLVGDAYHDAVTAFSHAIIDFCPSRAREMMPTNTAMTNGQTKKKKKRSPMSTRPASSLQVLPE